MKAQLYTGRLASDYTTRDRPPFVLKLDGRAIVAEPACVYAFVNRGGSSCRRWRCC